MVRNIGESRDDFIPGFHVADAHVSVAFRADGMFDPQILGAPELLVGFRRHERIIDGLAGAAYMSCAMDAATGIAAFLVAAMLLLSGREFACSRTLESLLYPVPGLILGVNYTASLATHLVRNGPMRAITTGHAAHAHPRHANQGHVRP